MLMHEMKMKNIPHVFALFRALVKLNCSEVFSIQKNRPRIIHAPI
jgi:hypothetical protein